MGPRAMIFSFWREKKGQRVSEYMVVKILSTICGEPRFKTKLAWEGEYQHL